MNKFAVVTLIALTTPILSFAGELYKLKSGDVQILADGHGGTVTYLCASLKLAEQIDYPKNEPFWAFRIITTGNEVVGGRASDPSNIICSE